MEVHHGDTEKKKKRTNGSLYDLCGEISEKFSRVDKKLNDSSPEKSPSFRLNSPMSQKSIQVPIKESNLFFLCVFVSLWLIFIFSVSLCLCG